MKLTRTLSFAIVWAILVSGAITGLAQAGAPPGTWASGIACQNLDPSNAASITLSFFAELNGTAALTYSDTIPAGGSKNYFTPSSPPGVPNPFLGAVVITSSAPLTCNVNTQTGAGTSGSPYRIGASAGFGGSSIATVLYMPQVEKAFSGWNSYLAVQNSDDSSATVQVTYRDRYGVAVPAATETATIPPGSNKVFYQSDNAGLPSGFLGSAKVVATNGKLLATMVNMYNSGADSSTSQFQSYSAFSNGAVKLWIPRILRRYYGYNSGLSIQNTGTVDTTVTITFYFAGNTYTYTSGTIVQGAALALYTPNISQLNPVDSLAMAQRFGNATIQANAPGALIVAIENEDNRGLAADNDGNPIPIERIGQGATYNAMLDGSQTTQVFFAQIARKAGGFFSGGFQVSNTTGSAGTCNFTFAGAPGANQTGVPLAANGSVARFGPNVVGLPDGFNAAVTATCTVPVVGISNFAVETGSGKLGDSYTQTNGLNQ